MTDGTKEVMNDCHGFWKRFRNDIENGTIILLDPREEYKKMKQEKIWKDS